MKRALAAVGDTGAAPGSSTKTSFQKRNEMREGLEGFFFLFLPHLPYNQNEGLLESRRKSGGQTCVSARKTHKEEEKMGILL